AELAFSAPGTFVEICRRATGARTAAGTDAAQPAAGHAEPLHRSGPGLRFHPQQLQPALLYFADLRPTDGPAVARPAQRLCSIAERSGTAAAIFKDLRLRLHQERDRRLTAAAEPGPAQSPGHQQETH